MDLISKFERNMRIRRIIFLTIGIVLIVLGIIFAVLYKNSEWTEVKHYEFLSDYTITHHNEDYFVPMVYLLALGFFELFCLGIFVVFNSPALRCTKVDGKVLIFYRPMLIRHVYYDGKCIDNSLKHLYDTGWKVRLHDNLSIIITFYRVFIHYDYKINFTDGRPEITL